jgi:hypothetical protein
MTDQVLFLLLGSFPFKCSSLQLSISHKVLHPDIKAGCKITVAYLLYSLFKWGVNKKINPSDQEHFRPVYS